MAILNSLMMTATGSGDTCEALEGTLWAWGQGSMFLGHNNTTDYSVPTQVGSLTDWTNNVGRFSHSATNHLIKSDGTLWTWGENVYGQCGLNAGDHTVIKYSSPVQVGSDTDWAQVAVGSVNSAAIRTDGTLWTWGNNWYGQLGLGDTTHRSSPTQVGSGTDWASVVCPLAYYIMMLKTDGTLWGCGVDRQGNLGQGSTVADGRSSPVQVGSATNWLAVEPAGNTVGGFVLGLASV